MWHHAQIQPQWLAISVAKWDRKKRIGFVCAAFTLESRTGNVFFESLSPRLMRCKDHVAGGFSIRWSLHHFRKPIPIRFIIKLPFSCWFPSGSGISTSCMVSSWLIPFARRFCKMGSSTWDVWGPRVYTRLSNEHQPFWRWLPQRIDKHSYTSAIFHLLFKNTQYLKQWLSKNGLPW